MKLKYHVVEYISYRSENGYPGLGTDETTQERFHFSSKKKAKRFIKRFMKDDPDYVRMWIAHITLTTVKHKTKMVKFPAEWADDVLISKKERTNVYKEAPISENELAMQRKMADVCEGMSHIHNKNKTGFDRFVDEQMESPSFASAYREAEVEIKKNYIGSDKHIPGMICPIEIDCDAVRCQNHKAAVAAGTVEDSDTFQA